ncbi:hypothetical protein VCV18_012367 [Metarhizium anisopliae]
MVEPGSPIIVAEDAPVAIPPRPTRQTRPSVRVQDTLRSFENAAVKPTKKATTREPRGPSTEGGGEQAEEGKRTRTTGETGKVILQRLLELLGKVGGEVAELKDKITDQSATILNQTDRISRQEDLISGLQIQLRDLREDFSRETRETREQLRSSNEELKKVQEQLETLRVATTSLQSSPKTSYADIARTPPSSQPTNLNTLSSTRTTPSSLTDTLHCTVDTSRVEVQDKNKVQVGDIRQAIEGELRTHVMNDDNLKDFTILAISEPFARKVGGAVVTTPNIHSNWTKMIPTVTHDTQWPIRSMLWIRRDLEAEQVPLPSGDLTGAVVRLPDRDVLVVSER